MYKDFKENLGQLLFLGIQGYTLTKGSINFLKIAQPGGIILFEHNIKDKSQVKKLIKDIKKHVKVTPFITCDQEGGQVERLRKISTSVPSPWGLAKVGEKELLEAQKILASDLIELGFNMTLAPVLDINTNPRNPIINTRAISNDLKIVSDYGVKITDLFLKNNLVPVAKHFPGHGDLDTDSHFDLPILSKSKVELDNFEFIPFKKVINKKIPAIMISHIGLPKIERDKKKPASISKSVINGILRNKLNFRGLLITDDLTMKGITKFHTLQNAAKEAILAGADMILLNATEKESLKVFNSLINESNKSKALYKRIRESHKRITSTKLKYLRKSNPKIDTTKNAILSHKIAQKVVHWIKKDFFFKPITKKEKLEIIYPVTPKLEVECLRRILHNIGLNSAKLISYNLNLKENEVLKALNKLNTNSRKILITYNALYWKKQKILIKGLLDVYPDSILISAGLENDVEVTPNIKNLIAAYAPNYISLLCAFEKLKVD